MKENEKKTKAPLGDRIKASGKKLGAFLKESLFKVFFIQNEAPAGNTAGTVKRLRVFRVFVCVLMAFLVLYYGYLMLLKGPQLKQEVFERQTRTFVTKAARGNIYDTNGNALAITVNTSTVSVSRAEIKNYGEKSYKDGDVDDYRKLVAKGLSDILGINYDATLEGLSKEEGNYWNVAVDVDESLGDRSRNGSRTRT